MDYLVGMNTTVSERMLFNKVAWRIMPVVFLAYIFAYLDRVNIGFAKLVMKDELWFSDAVFAMGSGIFFIGYFIFEVPGNILMHKIGARLWITRIMISWAILSGLCAFADNAIHFYILRFLLGVAEAGFFPAIILYLTYWFPKEKKAHMFAIFMTAVNFAGILGSPLSGWILEFTHGHPTIKAWQWLFIIEAIPSLILGICIPWLLSNGPQQAHWLSAEEKEVILSRLAKEEEEKRSEGNSNHRFIDAFRSYKVWFFALIYFCIVIALYGISFWLPQIIENAVSDNPIEIGLFAAIPWTCAAIGMILFARHSDRTGERRWHLTLVCLFGMLVFIASGLHNTSPLFVMITISLSTTAMMCAISTFWSLPSMILSGTAAAAGIAFINSVGNLGGFISPEMFAWFKTHYDLGAGLMAAGCSLGLAGVLIYWITKKQTIS